MANHEPILELLPAYALDCLDDHEAMVVARHLSGCGPCREELRAYEAVTDHLALALPEVVPAADLKDRLLAQIKPPAILVPSAPTVMGWTRWLGQLRRMGEVAFGRPAIALLVVLLLVSNIFLWRQLSQVRRPLGNFHYITLEAAVIYPGAQGVIVINESGRNGTLIVDGLPMLGETQQYQLWLLHNGEREDGGLFSIYSSGYFAMLIHAAEPLDQYTAFGITIEPTGGSPGPTGAKVLGSPP